MAVVKNSKKLINAWCMYDWANSVYNLVITATLFPVFYSKATSSAFNGDIVSFFGISITNSVLYSYALSASFLLVAGINPLLSGIADFGGIKKIFMKFFVYLGSASCIGLYWFTGQNVEYGIVLAMTASIGWSGSIVFYNAYLPEIATADRFDLVSARGYSLGYIGSVLLLLLAIFFTARPELLGLSTAGEVVRISFVAVGIWWVGFSQVPFRVLPNNIHKGKINRRILGMGYREINKVLGQVRKRPDLLKYLLAFFFYNAGVQAVMYLATLFGSQELRLSSDKLILTVLIIQFIAILGSYLFAWVSGKKGNRFSLMTMVVIWITVCIFAYYTYSEFEFYGVAAVVGLVMGGIQSLSRSSYSKLIPDDTIDHASYFSFYDVIEKLSIVTGTFAYGVTQHITGSMRNSVLALICLFVIGFVLLYFVSIPRKPKRRELLEQS